MGKTLWYSPDGRLINATKGHLAYLMDNAGAFGRSKDDITQVFSRFEEPVGWDGKAQREVLLSVLRDGWISIKYLPPLDHSWVVEYFAPRVGARRLRDCIHALVDRGEAMEEDSLKLVGLTDRNGKTVLADSRTYYGGEVQEDGKPLGGIASFISESRIHVFEEFIGSHKAQRAIAETPYYSGGNLSRMYSEVDPGVGVLSFTDDLSPGVVFEYKGDQRLYRIVNGRVRFIYQQSVQAL